MEKKVALAVEKTWITANDEIYWSNGVADQASLDKKTTLQLPMKAELVSVSGETAFSPLLLDPEHPVHAFVYKNSIDFIIRPWYILDSVPLDPAL